MLKYSIIIIIFCLFVCAQMNVSSVSLGGICMEIIIQVDILGVGNRFLPFAENLWTVPAGALRNHNKSKRR